MNDSGRKGRRRGSGHVWIPRNAIATINNGSDFGPGDADATASVNLRVSGLTACAAGNEVRVETVTASTGVASDRPFFILFQ